MKMFCYLIFGFGEKEEYKELNIFSDTSSSTFNIIDKKVNISLEKKNLKSFF